MKVNIEYPKLKWESQTVPISVKLEEWELFYLLAGKQLIGFAEKDTITIEIRLVKSE